MAETDSPSLADVAAPPALEARAVTKRFGAVEVLKGVSMTFRRGEITAIVGDNGAGKSTFMKVLAGEYRPDGGELLVDGRPATLLSTKDAQRFGIETVYQDLALAPDLTVAENVYLGRELVAPGLAGRLGVLDRPRMTARSREIMLGLGARLKSYAVPAQSLSGGQRQCVAIARALNWARNAVMLDEPTAALGARQREMVYGAIRGAAARDLAVLLISHDLPQVLELADRVIVLRQGLAVADLAPRDVGVRDVVDIMLGAGKAA
ncbi:sugar ABC transporter ATP-binding protein [Aureimonas endophytica]|uniref:Sugar ABC transporter ATP-binding protein n=1 Tax=Aureimonas endophytica TaxID=2027858 RepID=A0A917E611_9HYPH|nr:ATP-binding cassette domain-containing protein [Aureimonas endophytica]GGE04121.1 sugar ABC transporter ATP-binding protein [Aureimonas endophytica]